ncbi:hypothetical protein MPSEU_000410100 [Mayamaea pseudoterrestris]|nr:hypothetical protein MPSEU_000410100 [Mayamaea pseudoterrestris]
MKLLSATSLVALHLLPWSDAFTVPLHLSQRQQRRAFLNVPLQSSPASSSETSVVVKRLENSAVEVNIAVPGKATQAAYDKVANELSKTLSIPGFRKGSKIPPKVLEQVMSAKGGRNALKVQAIQDLIAQLVEPTLKEQSLDPIGQATLVKPAEEIAETYVPGEPIELQVKCDVWPDIKWATSKTNDEKPYVGLKAKYTRKPFNQERLDRALNDLKERYATLETIDDVNHALQLGDACVVQMDGYMATADGTKGDPLPNAASGDRVEVILGPGRYMEGLVDGLIGAKVGDTVTVKVSFPEKLRDKTLAGKPAIFDVKVLEASKRMVPDVTDDFANQVRAGLTADGLMDELRKAIDAEDAKEFVPERNKALGEALAEVFDVDVPDTLVTNQAREKYAVMMADMRANGVDDEVLKSQITPENFLKYKNIVKPGIERDFKISMATDEIARLENINIPAYQVEEQLESIRKDAAAQKEDIGDEKMIRAKVETTLQRQAVMEWLAERAELEVDYKDEEQFDENLMKQIAEDSLKREKELLGADVDVEALADDTIDIVAEETAAAPVEEAEPVASEPVDEVPAPAPVAEAAEEDEAARQARYAAMTVEERAYQVLKDLGSLDKL